MAKWTNDTVLEQGLNYIANNATEEYLCTEQPADRAAAIAASLIPAVEIDSGDFGAATDGDVSGRKRQVAAQPGQTANASGDATHIALCSSTTLLHVTTCTTQTVTSGNTVNLPAFDIEFGDPT
jgi:hypothetical protein